MLTISMILLTAIIPARINETLEQCVQRYGNPINEVTDSKDQKNIIFKKEPFNILIHLKNGKVVLIYYKKSDNDRISDGEIEKLLQINGVEDKATKKFGSKTYLSKDRKIQASHSILENYLVIAYVEYLKEMQKEDDKKSTEGL